jgi:hypothetical protein
MVATFGRREVTRIRELTREANQLERDITQRANELVPSLLKIPAGEHSPQTNSSVKPPTSTASNPATPNAMWAGVAPIPVWSVNNARFRLNRGGNRQTNAALHRIAITQIRIRPEAQAFIKRRLETGSTKREAVRLLKRKLADLAYRTLRADTQPDAPTQAA